MRREERIPKDVAFPFRDWGVVAIGLNRKTQTRRLMHPQPPRGMTVGNIYAAGSPQAEILEWILCDEDGDEVDKPCPQPRAWVGDRMYVKETYQEFCPLWDGAWCGHGTEEGMAEDHYVIYRASNPDGAFVWNGEVIHCKTWKPSRFMPKRCARYFRQFTRIRAARVREITGEEAIAEGCPQIVIDKYDPVHWFYSQWMDINGEESWARNDWVWVYEFAPGPPVPILSPADMPGW